MNTVAVLPELPPILGSPVTAREARKFLREFKLYKMRYEGLEIPPMRTLMSIEELEGLIEDALARGIWEPPIVTLAMRGNAELDEDQEEPDTSLIAGSLGDQHIEELFILVLGPHNMDEALELMKEIVMKDVSPRYSSLVPLHEFHKEWKDALRWTVHYPIPEKTLLKTYMRCLRPRELGDSLKIREFSTMSEAKKFVTEKYVQTSNARKDLEAAGGTGKEKNGEQKGFLDKAISKKNSSNDHRNRFQPNVAVRLNTQGAKPISYGVKEDRKVSFDSPKPIPECFHCGEKGHFRPNCPKLGNVTPKRSDGKDRRRDSSIMSTPQRFINRMLQIKKKLPVGGLAVWKVKVKPSVRSTENIRDPRIKEQIRKDNEYYRGVPPYQKGFTEEQELKARIEANKKRKIRIQEWNLDLNVDTCSAVNLISVRWMRVLQDRGFVIYPIEQFNIQSLNGEGDIKCKWLVRMDLEISGIRTVGKNKELFQVPKLYDIRFYIDTADHQELILGFSTIKKEPWILQYLSMIMDEQGLVSGIDRSPRWRTDDKAGLIGVFDIDGYEFDVAGYQMYHDTEEEAKVIEELLTIPMEESNISSENEKNELSNNNSITDNTYGERILDSRYAINNKFKKVARKRPKNAPSPEVAEWNKEKRSWEIVDSPFWKEAENLVSNVENNIEKSGEPPFDRSQWPGRSLEFAVSEDSKPPALVEERERRNYFEMLTSPDTSEEERVEKEFDHAMYGSSETSTDEAQSEDGGFKPARRRIAPEATFGCLSLKYNSSNIYENLECDESDDGNKEIEWPMVSSEVGDMEEEILRVVKQYPAVWKVHLHPQPIDYPPMTIQYKEGFESPFEGAPRRYAPAVEDAIQKEVTAQLSAGIIEENPEATHPSPVVMVKKNDSKSGYRFCIDYSRKNKGLLSDQYPLPMISEILDTVGSSAWFGTVDLRQGYWQFGVKEEDRPNTAFWACNRMYQYRRVPMGNARSAAYVQRAMHQLFKDVIGNGVIIYIDDVIIYAPTLECFVERLDRVLSIASRVGMQFKGSKSVLGATSIKILGHQLSKDGVNITDSRVQALMDVPFPRSTKELRSFCGSMNWIRRFIPNFSSRMKPLTSMVNFKAKNLYSVEAEKAFLDVKAAVAQHVKLSHLDYNELIVLRTDASNVGVGAVLCNRKEDGDHPIAFCSKAFSETESRWSTLEQEAYAVIFAVLFFKPLLWGHHFILETDHRNLQFIHGGTSSKVIRWQMILLDFEFTINHIPGVENNMADMLSRNLEGPQPDLVDAEPDFLPAYTCQVTSLRRSPRISPTSPHGEVLPSDDEESVEPNVRYSTLVTEESQKKTLFHQVHNAVMGHHGVARTVSLIKKLGFHWAEMAADIKKFRRECSTCQKQMAGVPDIQVVLGSIGTLEPFREVSIDFIGPLPTDAVGNSYIFNAVDNCTRFSELFAVEAPTAIVAAHCLLSIFCRYGVIRYIRSDRGTHFVNEIIDELLRLFEVEHILTLAERPQANGIAERNGGEIMRHLRALVFDKQVKELWSVLLPMVQRILNKTFRPVIGTTPNELIYFIPPNSDRGIFAPMREKPLFPPLESEFVQMIENHHERLAEITASHIYAEQEKLRSSTKEPTSLTSYQIGDYVTVSYLERPPSKLNLKWEGPFKVIGKEKNSYTLQDLTGEKPRKVDISRMQLFLVPQGENPIDIAARDKNESILTSISDFEGFVQPRSSMRFLCNWHDNTQSWESWNVVKRTLALTEFWKDLEKKGTKVPKSLKV